MKLERAPEYLTTFVAVLVGVFMAYYVGTLSGHGRFGMIGGLIASAGFFALLLALRERIWLLIPFCLPLTGQLDEVKGHPAIRDLAVLSVFAGVFALRAFKVIRRKPSYRAIDFWAGAILLYLLTVYVRNPVGGEALGSERVGGRPYLDVFTAALAYWTLARVALPVGLAQRAFLAIASINCVISALIVVQIRFPVTSPVIAQLIGGGGSDSSTVSDVDDDVGRKSYLAGLGNTILMWQLASLSPISLLNPLRILRFLCFVGSFILLLLSGYRSMVFNLGVLFLLATYLRQGWPNVIRLSVVGAILLSLLLLMQGTVFNLPDGAQRALSFLPGKWDRDVVTEAQLSSTWRFEMWDRMLNTDRYIESKWFGDGFGMTASQLQQSQTTIATSSPEQLQESFLISGVVHSGPVSTIRYVGYVGLFIYLCFMVVSAREAWVLCRLCKDTPYFNFALYTCLPIIYLPFDYIFVFGAFNGALPGSLISAGMLKMLRLSIEEYRATEPAPEAIPAPSYGAVAVGRPAPAHLQF